MNRQEQIEFMETAETRLNANFLERLKNPAIVNALSKFDKEIDMLVPDMNALRAAAWDYGNKHMKQNGRTVWNEDDFNAASKKFDEFIIHLEV